MAKKSEGNYLSCVPNAEFYFSSKVIHNPQKIINKPINLEFAIKDLVNFRCNENKKGDKTKRKEIKDSQTVSFLIDSH